MSRRTVVTLIAAAIMVLVSSAASAQTFNSRTDAPTLRRAADAGDVTAMFYLGMHYYRNGETKPQDYAQAAVWYRKASDSGDVSAMFWLGTLYWSGRGVTKDLVEAYKWLYLSGQSAPEQSRVRIAQTCESLARVMSAAQVAEAKQRAAAWQRAFAQKK